MFLEFQQQEVVKNLNIYQKKNSFVIQKLLDQGAIFIGKTNMDQFATGLGNSN